MLRTLYYALWIAPAIMFAVLSVVMVRRKQRNDYPFFFSYAIYQIIGFLVLLPSMALVGVFVYYFIGRPVYASLTDWGRDPAQALALKPGDSEIKSLLDQVASGARNGIPLERIKRNYDEASFRQLEFEIASGVYKELQVGSYVFMDVDYGNNRDREGKPVSDFENALFILTTVMSSPVPARAIVDAGLKALSVDAGMPKVVGHDKASFVRAADEHGRIEIAAGGRPFAVGEKIRLIPGHCDPTVNLHDWFVCIRDSRVESLWPVSARGAMF